MKVMNVTVMNRKIAKKKFKQISSIKESNVLLERRIKNKRKEKIISYKNIITPL